MSRLQQYPLALLLLLTVLVFSSILTPASSADDESPIHVFILAGQSNMVGMGSLEHLDVLIHDANCTCQKNPYYTKLWNATNDTYNVRQDVYIKYQDAVGPLTVDSKYAAPRHFGPELMFGYTMGDYFNTTTTTSATTSVLLIKTAFGGRNLAIDFRPPRSGEGNYSRVKPSLYGWEYRAMISEINDALDHMDDYIPSTAKTRNYTIDGFVWFQGWNDMLNWNFVREYETNLANLMRDVRVELDSPTLPFIIGELGMHGLNDTAGRGWDRVQAMRESEYNVTVGLSEFCNTSQFVRTAPYVNTSTGNLYGRIYHYYGRADTYYRIGEELGKGMVKLLERNKERGGDHSKVRLTPRLRRGWESAGY